MHGATASKNPAFTAHVICAASLEPFSSMPILFIQNNHSMKQMAYTFPKIIILLGVFSFYYHATQLLQVHTITLALVNSMPSYKLHQLTCIFLMLPKIFSLKPISSSSFTRGNSNRKKNQSNVHSPVYNKP